jgi:RNA polymerase sigma-70 factor (ECF subfamily)
VDDDAALVAAARAGDRRALDDLLRAHQPRWWALCRRLTGDDADAADALQDAMVAIVRGLPRFDGRSAFSTWSYRVATNACLDELRRRRRRPVPSDGDVLAGVAERDRGRGDGGHVGGAHGPDLADRTTDRLVLDDALAALDPSFRAAVVLRDVLGLDYADIATVLDVPPGTVRSRISRGRAALARALDEGNPPEPARRPSPRP